MGRVYVGRKPGLIMVILLAGLLLLVTSAARLNTSWLVPSGQVKVDHRLLSSAKPRICALTFDDGPDDLYTEKVAAVLADKSVRATFFVLGSKIARREEQVLSLVEAGHEIANHSWSHPNMPTLSKAQQLSQIQRTNDALAKLGITSHWFRPPYGEFNSTTVTVARAEGQETILWSVDPQDWMRPGADQIKSRVVKGVTPGAVVLLHSTNGQTLECLPGLIDKLRSEGYIFVTMSQWRDAVTGNLDFADLHDLTAPPVQPVEVMLPGADAPLERPASPPSLPRLNDARGKFSVHTNFESSTRLSTVFRRGGRATLYSFDHQAAVADGHSAGETAHEHSHSAHAPAISLSAPPVLAVPREAEPEQRPAQDTTLPAVTSLADLVPQRTLQSSASALQSYSLSTPLPWSGAIARGPRWSTVLTGAASDAQLNMLKGFVDQAQFTGVIHGAAAGTNNDARATLRLGEEGFAELLRILRTAPLEVFIELPVSVVGELETRDGYATLPQIARDILLLRLMTQGFSVENERASTLGLPRSIEAAVFSSGDHRVVVLTSSDGRDVELTLPSQLAGGLQAELTDAHGIGMYVPGATLTVGASPLFLYYNRGW